MKNNTIAVLRMEEGYMRLTLEYTHPKFKTEICKHIAALENSLNIYPEVLHRQDSDKKCFTSVEFSGDEYTCSRTCGEFIENIINGLKIKECIND